MSYAAFKMVHCLTSMDTCVSAYVTHNAGETDSDSIRLLPGAKLITSGATGPALPEGIQYSFSQLRGIAGLLLAL